MIHTLSAAISISGGVQYQLRMNLILSNFEMSNGIGQIVKVQLNEKKSLKAVSQTYRYIQQGL